MKYIPANILETYSPKTVAMKSDKSVQNLRDKEEAVKSQGEKKDKKRD